MSNLARPLTLCVLLLLSGMLLLAACAPDEPPPLPTQAATVVAIIPTATPTPLPPTQDLSVLTVTPEPTSTRPPTPTPTPIDPFITMTDPDPGDTLVQATEVVVRGIANLNDTDTIEVALVALNGRQLAQVAGERNEIGWSAPLLVPEFVSGPATLHAKVISAEATTVASYEMPVFIETDTDSAVRFLTVSAPQPGQTAQGGFNLFFAGEAQQPIGGSITLSVWNADCQNLVAREVYPLRGSGAWQGFMILPPEAEGDACAIVSFGPEGDLGWREVQLPMTLFSAEDPDAAGVQIANPTTDAVWLAGSSQLVNGIALGAIVQPVNVQVMLENGRVIAQSSPETDYWGYWELNVNLPSGTEGPARVVATYGTEGEPGYATSETIFMIEPEDAEE